MKDITELSVTTVTDFKDLQNVLRNYNKDVEHPKVTGAMIIKVTAARVDHNVNWMARKAVGLIKTGHVKKHMAILSDTLTDGTD